MQVSGLLAKLQVARGSRVWVFRVYRLSRPNFGDLGFEKLSFSLQNRSEALNPEVQSLQLTLQP